MTKNYRFVEHTADIAIEVTGDDLKSLFLNCGYALFDVLYQKKSVTGAKKYRIKAVGDNNEELLINFLRELFFKFAIYKVVLSEITEITLADNEISATVIGEDYNAKKHKTNLEIKAVTYHNVKIEEENGKLKVVIVLDT